MQSCRISPPQYNQSSSISKYCKDLDPKVGRDSLVEMLKVTGNSLRIFPILSIRIVFTYVNTFVLVHTYVHSSHYPDQLALFGVLDTVLTVYKKLIAVLRLAACNNYC